MQSEIRKGPVLLELGHYQFLLVGCSLCTLQDKFVINKTQPQRSILGRLGICLNQLLDSSSRPEFNIVSIFASELNLKEN